MQSCDIDCAARCAYGGGMGKRCNGRDFPDTCLDAALNVSDSIAIAFQIYLETVVQGSCSDAVGMSQRPPIRTNDQVISRNK